MPPHRLVLASASPARLRLLQAAGLDPDVVVSGVREDDVEGPPAHVAFELARRKAAAVADRVGPNSLVVGCDSVLDLDGVALGKPADTAEALARWQDMRGRTGTLVTGQCVVDTSAQRWAEGVATTVVRFAAVDDRDLRDYLATGEPLAVAGAFTIDGLGGWFVDGVDGDPGTVVGLSLPLLRRLFAELGVRVGDLWAARPR